MCGNVLFSIYLHEVVVECLEMLILVILQLTKKGVYNYLDLHSLNGVKLTFFNYNLLFLRTQYKFFFFNTYKQFL